MKSRTKHGSKHRVRFRPRLARRYPPPVIAWRLTVKPLSTRSGTKRLRAESPASVRRKAARMSEAVQMAAANL